MSVLTSKRIRPVPPVPRRRKRGAGNYMLLGDAPFCGAKDPLGFEEIASSLAELVLLAREATPFTLGIEGGWGTGKSSLMQRIEPLLRHQPRVTTVWFNAWAVEDGEALEGLIKSVLAALDKRVLRRIARNKQLIGWAKVAVTIAGAWLGLGSLVNSIWSALDVDPKARNDLQELMRSAMADWVGEGAELEDGRLLVVFIDDLDRASPQNVFQIFEAIKVHLSTPGMAFVVGYDKQIVSDAVLKEKQYSAAIKSGDYLEKIIQVSYRMPRPSDEAGERLIDSYLRDSGTKKLFSDPTLRSLAVERNARNPRRIKRFINAFILEWGLDAEWSRQKFDPAVVVRVVILYMYFTDFALLLEESEDEDPVEKFQSYCQVRELLWQRPGLSDRDAWEPIEAFASTYSLRRIAVAEPVDYQAVLKELEEQLPACFPALASHLDFINLIVGLGEGEERERLLAKLRRTRPSVRAVEEPDPVPVAPEATDQGIQPLPAPRRPAPHRLDLAEVVDRKRIDEIRGQGSLVFQTAGSTGGVKNPLPQAAVAGAMRADFDEQKLAPAFMYLLGDVIYFNGRAEDYFAQFYEPYADYPAPIFAIPGNHDADNADDPSIPSLAAFVDNFCAPAALPTPESRGTRPAMIQPNVYWTLRAPFTTIIGLYTNVPPMGYFDRDQLNWLVDELRAAPPDDALIVALHHEPYGASANFKGSMRMARALDEAFMKAERAADLVLAAQAHNYQRFSRPWHGRQVTYVVAGAGGYHNLHRMGSDVTAGLQHGDLTLEQFCDDRYGFLRVTTAPGMLRGEYVTVPGRGGKDATPTVVDSFLLALGPAPVASALVGGPRG